MKRLTVFVRHAPEPANMRLLDRLGVVVVIDPAAPSCAFNGGTRGHFSMCPRCKAIDRQRDRRSGVRSRHAKVRRGDRD